MTTRFFLEGPGNVPSNPTPAFAAEWDDTAENNLLSLVRYPLASGFGVWFQSNDPTAASNRDTILNQYIGAPFTLQGALSGTLKGQARVQEPFTATGAIRSQIIVRVFNNDGTVERGVAYPGDLEELTGTPASAWPTAGFVNREIPRGGPVNLTEVAYQIGDRLVVEVGFRKHAAASATGRLEPLPDGSSTFLPEDETETGAFWGWIEFSQNLPLTGQPRPLQRLLDRRLSRVLERSSYAPRTPWGA